MNDHTPLEGIPAFFQAFTHTLFRQNQPSPRLPTGSDEERENDPLAAENVHDEDSHNSSGSERNSNTNQDLVTMEPEPCHTPQTLHSRRKRSNIHSQTHLALHNGATYFQCNYCTQKYKRSGGTRNVRDHLTKVHGWDGLTTLQLKRKRENQEIDVVMERYAPNEVKRWKAKRAELLKDSINKDTLEYLYVRYTLNANTPFSQVEHPDFRILLEYINPAANTALPNSHNTIRSRVMELYQEGKQRVASILQAALSSIHITCDAWTTPNHIGAWGIVGHFTSEEGVLCDLLLSLSEQQGSHSGFNQAQMVLNTLTVYNIRNRLGHFVMDNATTNDALMDHISADLETEGIVYDARQHRLRCNGHIINLAVSAFLFGKNPVAEAQAEGNHEPRIGPSTAELNTWRKMGPLGKLHNIIIYITASTPRTQAFLRQCGGYMPRWGNKTRWSSWYSMLDWSLTKTGVLPHHCFFFFSH